MPAAKPTLLIVKQNTRIKFENIVQYEPQQIVGVFW